MFFFLAKCVYSKAWTGLQASDIVQNLKVFRFLPSWHSQGEWLDDVFRKCSATSESIGAVLVENIREKGALRAAIFCLVAFKYPRRCELETFADAAAESFLKASNGPTSSTSKPSEWSVRVCIEWSCVMEKVHCDVEIN